MYWDLDTGSIFTLRGRRPLAASEPVCHVTYYEADAFARWAGARLPREAEWELAAEHDEAGAESHGSFMEDDVLHPRAARPTRPGIAQLLGDAWEWTASAYAPYPGFTPLPGAFGEYNGKFMVSQMVLRGGSCATPRDHIRTTYRNFFPPGAAWQFSGIRLAKDAV
jgi:ergothioneine biosynthesis protein EgtB